MTTTTTPAALSRRDRAVLLAVRAGRCEVSGGAAIISLTVDGLLCSDQFVGHRLVQAGLIASPTPAPGRARLTLSGRTVLEAA